MSKSLQTIQEHIKNAPGSYLSRLRTKFTKKSGLVQNSKIQSELCSEISNEERLHKWLSKKNEWEVLALSLIYASQSRGLHFKELERNLEADHKSLAAFLNEAANEMFIWHAKCQGSSVYYGFADFENFIFNSQFKNEETPESHAWVSNEKKADLHLLFMLAKIQLGKISVKKDDTLSHFSKKHIAEIFCNNKTFDNSIIENSIHIQLSFLISEKWISKPAESGHLKLLPAAYEFLRNNGFRLFSELFFWWERERFRNRNDLLKLLKCFEKPIGVFNASRLFWPHDTRSRLPKSKTSINWHSLPLPLRELWILGIVKMQMKKKHILMFSLTEFGESILFAKKPGENLSEPIIASSSNFEWLLSQSNGAFRVFQMSCFAKAKNEEELLRFALSRESFLDGLHSGLPNDYVKDFMSWNRAVPNVANTLSDWYHIYNDSSIDFLHILRIKNPDKFAELSVYKPFLSCVEEIIPNWGFVIKAENEKKIRDILTHFSLEPSSSVSKQDKEEPLNRLAETENFKLPCPIPEGGDLNM
ncbi:MAG: hypothetical protein LBB36_03540 [Fibromonadaceae bacterium]|jgi:hypothetical protein|nr:hypothetical protein [Fibromonadaceae bacterium]